MKVEILYYSSDWTPKWKIENIKNLDKIQYNEIINWGQSWFDLELWVKFDDLSYSYWDLVEYVIYNDDYKKWIHKFTWTITWIKRNINIKNWEYVKLEIKWLVSLLSDDNYSISKTYSWTLTAVIDEFIFDFHSQYNISNEMLYLWTQIFKNSISSTASINVAVDWNFFKALEKIFWENREFFINKLWEIILTSEVTETKIFTMNTDIYEAEIDEEWSIDLYISWYKDFNLEVWQNIILQNIKSQLNLEWKKITELVFSLDKILINAWKILNYKNL